MKFVRSVQLHRTEVKGSRFAVELNWVKAANRFKLLHRLNKLDVTGSIPNIRGGGDGLILYLYAEDELDAAVKANRMLQQALGLEETQDAE